MNVSESQKEAMELPLFSFSTIAKATANFSPDNKLGEGGFGVVYKVSGECNFYTVNKLIIPYKKRKRQCYPLDCLECQNHIFLRNKFFLEQPKKKETQ